MKNIKPRYQSQNVSLNVPLMYSYDQKNNIPWNISQYKPIVDYFDYENIIKKRNYLKKKKGSKQQRYVTKKGFYMDRLIQVGKSIPSSIDYIRQNPWQIMKKPMDKQKLKKSKQAIKYTYLQQLLNQQKKKPKPGVGTYQLIQSPQDLEKEIQKKSNDIKHDQKRYFYDNTYALSNQIPGSGYYNPHQSIDKEYKNKKDWKFWTTKHAQMNKIQKQKDSKSPGAGSYSPLSQSNKTFQTTSRMSQKSLEKKNAFGTDTRFPYIRPNKKVIKQKRPTPFTYDTRIQWKSKNSSLKKKNWINIISKGRSNSVYH